VIWYNKLVSTFTAFCYHLICIWKGKKHIYLTLLENKKRLLQKTIMCYKYYTQTIYHLQGRNDYSRHCVTFCNA
jgi:hypothetical protein